MKKFENLLFVTDLDGTLLRHDKSISKENLDAIEYFKSEGGLFTFITGRMPDASADVYTTLDPNIPFGCINGGGLYDHRKMEYLWMASLPDEAMELVAYIDREMPEVGIQLNTSKHIYFNKDNSAMVEFRRVTGLPNIACHYSEVKEPVAKVIFADDDESALMEVKRLLDGHPLAPKFTFIRSERTLYEILPLGISKATSLTKLCELLSLDIKRTLAVGDYDNDIGMIKTAGLGIAVANASDNAKAAADHITVGVNDHAIAKIIEGLDKGILKV